MNEYSVRPRASRFVVSALAMLGVIAVVPSSASAHFTLDAPESYMSQDLLGSPQKAPPCGDDGSGTLTGAITAFQAGQTITITIDEKIFHPGHYRVALAPNDPSELPPEPPVTAGSTDCGSTTIMDPPVYPVLADGMLLHTTSFSGPQSFEVTLPTDVTCDHCTLQVIEFMSEHPLNNPGGCFYHHCANISITSVPVGTGGAGGSGAGGSGGSATAGSSGAGGSSASGASGAAGSSNAGAGGTSAGTASSDAPASSDSGGCSVFAPGAAGLSGVGVLMGLAALIRRRRH